ncbi:MAG: retropepsin-like domain-containing protein [Candidatus Eremiobacteraeota bacterium]|nr:retropepsin-like domain-containing protein [Candidatus Eremiobacteraeota bacterium]
MKRILSSLLAVALLASLAPAARADDAASLLAKHRAYVGWQFGDGTVTSYKATGQSTSDSAGKPEVYRTLTLLQLGAIFRKTQHSPKIGRDTANGFTGNIFWESDMNGFTHPIAGDALNLQASQAILFNEGTTALPGTLHGSATIDGIACTIVRVTPEHGDAIDLYIDPSTGAYKRAVIDPDGTYETPIDILAYSDVLPGKKIISKFKGQHSKYTTEYTSFQGNVPVAIPDLHPPSPIASWTFANPQPFHVTITDDRVYFDATVNGAKGRFILDTGNGVGMSFTKSFADRAGIKSLEGGRAFGIGGGVDIQYGTVKSFVVGGNTLSGAIADFDDSRLDADGIIGYTMLAGVISRLSYSNSTLTIEDPSTDVTSVQGIHTIIDLSGGQPAIPMKLDGKIDVLATLDSGNPLYVAFGKDIIFKYGVRMIRGELLAAGVGGYEVEECGHIDELSVGPIRFQTPSSCVSPAFTGRDVLVGFSFMKNFDFVFDYPHVGMVMTPIQH